MKVDTLSFQLLCVQMKNSEEQIINTIYDHFQKFGKWPGARTVHNELGKETVEKIFIQKKPRPIEKIQDNRML